MEISRRRLISQESLFLSVTSISKIGRKENQMLPPVIDRQSILHAELRRLVAQGESLQMTTNYKGVTLTQRMTGIFFDESYIRFNPLHHVICNMPGQRIYIHNNCLPQSVTTTISGIDLIAGAVRISQFEYSDHPFRARRKDRVQPNHPIRAVLSVSHTPYSACLVDISEDGLGALYFQAHESEAEIKIGQSVRVNLRLPNIFTPLLLTGKITRSRRIGKSTMLSIGIQLTSTEKQVNQLKVYIRTRQAEIMDELSNSIRTVLEPIQTKDLYF